MRWCGAIVEVKRCQVSMPQGQRNVAVHRHAQCVLASWTTQYKKEIKRWLVRPIETRSCSRQFSADGVTRAVVQ